MDLQEKIISDILKLNYIFDCRKSLTAKPGLIDLCKYIEEKLGRDITLIEIGTFSGISSFIFSYFFNKIITIDPYLSGYDNNDKASVMDLNLVEDEFITKTMKNRPNITKIKMLSKDASKQFENNFLDIVYIDGNHSYEGVKDDLKIWIPKVKKGSYIAGHDFKNGHHPGVYKAVTEVFNEKDIITFKDTSWISQIK